MFQVLRYFVIVLLTTCFFVQPAPCRTKITPRNIDKAPVNFDLKLGLSGEVFEIKLFVSPGQSKLDLRHSARLELRAGRKPQGEFQIASYKKGDDYVYRFSLHADFIEESVFEFKNHGNIYAFELAEFCQVDSLMHFQVELSEGILRQGESTLLKVTANGKADLIVHFSSGCQFGYVIESMDGEVYDPEGLRPCTLALTMLEFDSNRSYSRELKLLTFAPKDERWPFRDGYLPPGKYTVRGGLVGVGRIIPWAKTSLEVLPK